MYILCSSNTCFSPVCLGVKHPCYAQPPKECSLRERDHSWAFLPFAGESGSTISCSWVHRQVHHHCWCIVTVQVSELDKIHPKHSWTAGAAEVFRSACEGTFYFVLSYLKNKAYKFLLNSMSGIDLSVFLHHALSKVWIKPRCTAVLANDFCHSCLSLPPPLPAVTIGGNTTSLYSLCTLPTYHINRQKLSRLKFYFLLLNN